MYQTFINLIDFTRSYMINLLQNNPFRILGVFSNSAMKDIVANEGKMKAFLKVGRAVSYPLDLTSFIPAVERDENAVASAKSQIALTEDKIRYAQFWFIKSTTIDDIAFNHLFKGDFDGAVETFKKKRSASSLQNLVVCNLIKDNYEEAIQTAASLYSEFNDDFVKAIDQQATVDKKALINQFVSGLVSSGINLSSLKVSLSDPDWNEAINGIVSKPLVDKLKKALETARSSRGKGSIARLNAGKKLMAAVKIDLTKLKNHLDNLKYQILADELANEILQCGIDYFNDSEDEDAAHSAMPIQKYALSIAVGNITKDRCKENVDILQKIIASLPPKEVSVEAKAIRKELEKFCELPDKISHSMTLLNATRPLVQTIKNKLGSTNPFYLKISTQIVGNALHNVIEEVNSVMEKFKLYTSFNGGSSADLKRIAIVSLQETLQSAWDTTKIMDSFDLESDFKSRYNTNRTTLKSLCDQVGITTSAFSRPTPRSTYGPYASTAYGASSSSNKSNDTNWGCIIAIVVFIIIMIIANAK